MSGDPTGDFVNGLTNDAPSILRRWGFLVGAIIAASGLAVVFTHVL